jgi:hypothetical protein
VLRLTGSLAWLFTAVALGLLLHGLIVFAAILSGAWFRGDRLTKSLLEPDFILRRPGERRAICRDGL